MSKLPDELAVTVLGFLSAKELALASQVSKRLYQSDGVRYLWTQHCLSKWNCDLSRNIFDVPKAEFRRLYPYAWPICSSLFADDGRISTQGLKAIYSGPIGIGNRSIQAYEAFPPVVGEVTKSWFSYFVSCCRMEEILHRHYQRCTTLISTPFMDASERITHVAARSIAYYEIHISRAADYSDDETVAVPDCIAVGLASKQFPAHIALPGWDQHSYGFHSDDGAIFHGKGQKVAPYGRVFGVGDTVGCGIHYPTRSIFFTLNGKYLGVAFEGVVGELYPTVGVDARVSIDFNFGLQPFEFSLLSYMHHLID